MTSTIRDVMSTDLVACRTSASITDAARLMRDRSIGDVLVVDGAGQLAGIVTDRDLVVRCLADSAPGDADLGNACSPELTTVPADCSVDDAVALMRDRALRRLPVVEQGRPVGIVSLGDLAIERDPQSVLGNISAARPNR